MSKNLILCCDGTSNEFGRTNTNVVRLFQCLDRSPAAGQVAYYDPGVGTLATPTLATRTARALSRGIGLAFGAGIITNINEAICFLMQQYEQGDQVYIFGFSRGAYTARAIAGLLHKCGLPEAGAVNMLPYLIRMFRNTVDWDVSNSFKATFDRPCPVRFLGLWDTVSTIGWIYNPQHFPYTRTNPDVRIVRHAVALDERRCFYRTNLWGTQKHEGTRPAQEQDANEVWFPGVHSDVGGGYPPKESMLWKYPFCWMVREAQAAGIKFLPDRVSKFLEAKTSSGQDWYCDDQHFSLRGLWWACEFLPKKYWDERYEPACYRFRIPVGKCREVPNGALLHRSILDRIRARNDYRPKNLACSFIKDALAREPRTDTVTYRAESISDQSLAHGAVKTLTP